MSSGETSDTDDYGQKGPKDTDAKVLFYWPIEFEINLWVFFPKGLRLSRFETNAIEL